MDVKIFYNLIKLSAFVYCSFLIFADNVSNAADGSSCAKQRNNPREVYRAMPNRIFTNHPSWSGLKQYEKDLLAKASINTRDSLAHESCTPFIGTEPEDIKNVRWAEGEAFSGEGLESLNKLFYDINTDHNMRVSGLYIIISSGYRSFHEQLAAWAPNLRNYFAQIKDNLAEFIVYDEPKKENKKEKSETKTTDKTEKLDPSKNNKGIDATINIRGKEIKADDKSAETAKINPKYSNQAVAYLRSYVAARFAFPGFSNHQSGDAVDFQIIDENGNRLSANTRSENVKAWCKTTTYQWLIRNADKYGFIQDEIDEPWHWIYNPNRTNKKDYRVYIAPSCRDHVGKEYL